MASDGMNGVDVSQPEPHTVHSTAEPAAPLVTVLIPVYNGEKYLADAVRSIVDQTYRNLEILVIDDGSTDASRRILEDFARNDDRFVVICRENRGLVATLNEGLERARGKYVARMDADDISLPERIERQVRFMEAHEEIGICGTNVIKFGRVGESLSNFGLTHDELDAQLLIGPPFAHPSVMIRKSVLDEAGLRYDATYVHCEDYDLWQRLFKVTRTANLPEHLLRYRIHNENISDVNAPTTEKGHLSVARRVFDEIGLEPSDTELRQMLVKDSGRGGVDRVNALYSRLWQANESQGRFEREALARVLMARYRRAIERYYGLPGWLAVHGKMPDWAKEGIPTDWHGRVLRSAVIRSIKNALKRLTRKA